MEGTSITTFIETVTAPMESTLTLANLGTIIAAGLAIAVVFVLGWFAFRWIWGKVKKSFLGGR